MLQVNVCFWCLASKGEHREDALCVSSKLRMFILWQFSNFFRVWCLFSVISNFVSPRRCRVEGDKKVYEPKATVVVLKIVLQYEFNHCFSVSLICKSMSTFNSHCCLLIQIGWVLPALKPTEEQKAYLLSYLEMRPMLAQKEYGTADGRIAAKKEWETLAAELNSMTRGSQKSSTQWMKVGSSHHFTLFHFKYQFYHFFFLL